MYPWIVYLVPFMIVCPTENSCLKRTQKKRAENPLPPGSECWYIKVDICPSPRRQSTQLITVLVSLRLSKLSWQIPSGVSGSCFRYRSHIIHHSTSLTGSSPIVYMWELSSGCLVDTPFVAGADLDATDMVESVMLPSELAVLPVWVVLVPGPAVVPFFVLISRQQNMATKALRKREPLKQYMKKLRQLLK